jgi:aryl-alcohol dehydrogenase-like predicted oxidoreductase
MKRREFLKQSAATAAMLSVFPATLAGVERDTKSKGLEHRALGRTGRKLSLIGFGGLVLKNTSPEESSELVRLAYQSGVNYFDVAPSYGNAETRMGPALEPYRKNVFLACKTARRTRDEALRELDRSLELLRTDYFDLYQLHHVTTLEEVKTLFGPEGAMKAFTEAKQDGRVKLLGFSAPSVEAALALMERFDFDTILFPVNYATWHAGNFGPQVLAQAHQKRMGILAIKAMAKGPWANRADRKTSPKCWYEPMTDPAEALLGLRFTLSHPVTSAVHPADERCLKLALRLGPKFTPLKSEEAQALKRKAMETGLIFRYPRRERG